MNPFDIIDNMMRDWYRRFGAQPTNVYVGRKEWGELRRHIEAHKYLIADANGAPNELFGMTLHITDDDSHIGFGIP